MKLKFEGSACACIHTFHTTRELKFSHCLEFLEFEYKQLLFKTTQRFVLTQVVRAVV